LCYYWDAFTGYTTDPRLVAATIDVLREKYGLENADIKIVEADATAMRTSHAFRMLGYEKLAEEKEVELFNLSLDKIIEMKVTVNGREISFPIPESLLKADLFINMPKMKIMSATTITCAFKNLFGCIASPRKIIYHPILSEAIVGVNKILHPHLTIVDGIVALGQHPVNLNLIVAGFNSFAVDWVVSEIMGYNPSRISYLKLAQAAGVGTPNDIKVVGEKIEQFRNQFPHVNAFLLKRQNNLQLKLLRLYSRTVGDVIPPILEK
jgi:uncharacterized protein (DUF362 family)